MKIKVSMFNKSVRSDFYKYFSFITAIISVILIFTEIPPNNKYKYGIFFIILCIILYLTVWIIANKRQKIKLNIGGTSIWIKADNLFDQEGLKVIPFNEYYDTQVDDIIISNNSLNGQYINKFWDNKASLKKLDKLISTNKKLNSEENIVKTGINRDGKTIKYDIGSMIVIDEYVLTAFSRFDDSNCAKLTITDYFNFLIRFWNEINVVYAQKKVSVPIFGSGITRFTNGMEDINENELLRIMIWTFKVSKIKFEFPADLTIIIHPDKIDRIDIFSLKEEEE